MTRQTKIEVSSVEATCQHCDQPVAWSYAMRAFVHISSGTTACSTEGPRDGDQLYRRNR